jgi:peroxin-2
VHSSAIMPSADFAAAQARIAARRQQRLEEQNRQLRSRGLQPRNISSQPSQPGASPSGSTPTPTLRPSRLSPIHTLASTSWSVFDAIRGREGTKPAFRVGQVDAELLDEELLELLKAQVGEGLKYYGTHLQTDFSAEILLVLRALLFKLTMWDHNASYGASLQGLRYTDARGMAGNKPQSLLSAPTPKTWQKAVYGAVTVFGRYAWTKWEGYLIDQEGGYDTPSASIRRLSEVTNTLSNIHNVASLTSFLAFLLTGRYRTLLDRILRLRLVPSGAQATRELSFEYLNRQLVWHAFTEFLLFLLPLVGVSRWRRIMARLWRKAVANTKNFFWPSATANEGAEDEDRYGKKRTGGELGFLPERTCAICYSDQNPIAGVGGEGQEALLGAVGGGGGGGVVGSASTDITNPYEAMPCGDVYCFVCLAQKIEAEEGDGWTCLRCGELVLECKPWNGDVIESKRHAQHMRDRSSVGGAGVISTPTKTVGFYDTAHHSTQHGQPPLTPGNLSDVTMRELEPIPTEDELEALEEEEPPTPAGAERIYHDADIGNDSAEWARASEVIEDESDEGGSSYDEHSGEDEDDTETEDEYYSRHGRGGMRFERE